MEFVRDHRAPAPQVPSGAVRVRPPPEVPAVPQANPLIRLLPVVMLVAAGGMVVLYLSGDRLPTARSPMYLVLPVMMLVSVLATAAHGMRGRTTEIDAGRRDYLRYLDGVGQDAAATADAQHANLLWTHPDPAALWTVAGTARMWERRATDPDFCLVRVGIGPAILATPLTVEDSSPVGETDPVTQAALDALLTSHAIVPGLPVVTELSGHLGFGGAAAAARDLVRAIVCQLAMWHSPADIRIVARAGAGAGAGDRCWDWLKWLPHHAYASSAARTVLIVDDDRPVAAGAADIVLELGGHGDRRIEAGPGSDAVSAEQALLCARRVARWRPGAARSGAAVPGWAELVGMDGPPLRSPDSRVRLRVPIGTGDGPDNRGMPVYLDIKEAAEGGMGPHGLCVGATGSGKSEFLRTLVLGLAAMHTSDELNLALIDFKGGATFLGFERLSHVAAVITNLAEEAHLVSRMQAALTGEMQRRQQLLRASGTGNITEYRRARAAGRDLTVLPVLFLVIDEFSELLSRHPDFAEVFLAVGRLGRSLGMHLLLASQRLDEGRLRGLEAHLSYRICLKTFSTSDSRAVIGVPDAYELSAEPGSAYLKTVDGELVKLRTTYVSGPARRVAEEPAGVALFTLFPPPAAPTGSARQVPTVLETMLDRLAGHGRPAHRIWLPPLSAPPTLTDLLTEHDGPRLTAPIGLVDNAFDQRRDPFTVDLTGAGGHVAVVGATRSGKSTALCTLLLALAMRHGPGDIQFYCLDLGGGTLAALRGLPHIGVLAGRDEPELVARTIATVQTLIRRRAAQPARSDGYGEVFLVIDGWAALREDGGVFQDAVTDIAAHGLAHGVHVMISAARWAELRPALKDQLGSRVELRLGEPGESEIHRTAARQLTGSPPGTALTRDGNLAALALPHLDSSDVAGSVRAVLTRHPGPTAPPVRLLPARLDRERLPRSVRPPTHVVMGIGETELGAVTVDFTDSAHLIVLGDSGCGKTALLRTLCVQLTKACEPGEVRLYLADARRTLLGVVDDAHLGGYAISAAILGEQLRGLADMLRGRLPGASVSQQELRDRSWWSGPEIYLVVDDHELLTAGTDPLNPLLEFLPYARDIGLHLVVARRAGGAARALYDPVPAMMRELGSAGLVMSTATDEGPLLGATRPAVLPPGRATLVLRGHAVERVQIAWTEPP
ncbi:type VII secretion protein EccCb [Mycolicibacterium neoaurum]|uniref:type VII secretion protein EccCb n=1 Tax=Mycolicibacterium neoaurum TaxID=1795 RepID=UPI00248AF036|nr:type VII secretion protein EccCb [Mycolicibacterium neoaurum]WBP96391.1 type VII secretion protein EccCb [Mycolicibacterium neoaurum]WBS10078.1 type VII secretion protein EccCb [Mycolicibacterium neoaurum]